MGAGGGQETLTILFTDVEGSTAYRSRAGEAAANRLMTDHERLVSDQVLRHDGRHIKSLGDGCMAVFSSPRRAVECAVAVQRASAEAPLAVRMGLNVGEVTLTQDDVFGSAVNAAARISAKAAGGQIFVSDLMRQLMGAGVGLPLRDRGRVRLKGFPERWRLFEVVWRDERVVGAPPELTPFVGRAAELARLHRLLDNLGTGRGGVAIIRGEAGIGKTRLATEAVDHARTAGCRVLAGRTSPPRSGLGFEPIVEAFGALFRASEAAELADLTQDLPQLGRLFEHLGLPAPPPVGDPGLERTLLFDSVARLVERLSERTPTILLIDDAQWADPATLELLHHLARSIERSAAALVLTCRTGDPEESERVRPLLVSLRRLRVVEEIDLHRLAPRTVENLAREFLGGPVPSGLLDVLVRASGTPLFVDSFLRNLLESGRLTRVGETWRLTDAAIEVPTAVRDVILERLDGLDPDARRVVELAAVAGGALPYDVLASSGELAPDSLATAVEHLASVGVLAEDLDGGDLAYRLSHPLYVEVATGALSEIGRRRAHATLATALERIRPSDIEGLGRHYLGAGPALDPARAVEVFGHAGGLAARRGAYAEAVRFFEPSARLAREAGDGQLPGLLEQLAEAQHRSGETDAAVATWTEALVLRQAVGDTACTARIHGALGIAEFDRGRLVEAADHLQVAARELEAVAPTPGHTAVHFARVTVLRRLGGRAELLDVAAQLEGLADALGTPTARAGACYARAAALYANDHPIEALEHGLRGLDWVRQGGDDAIAYRLHTVCGDAAVMLGDHAGLQDHAEAGWQLARTLGRATLAGGAAHYRLLAAVLSGAWDDALAFSDEFLEIARRLDNPRLTATVLASRAWFLTLRGDLGPAEALLAELREGSDPAWQADRRGFGFATKAEARLLLERGEPERAAAVLGAEDSEPDWWPLVLSQAEARTRAGDLEGARRALVVLAARGSPLLAAEAGYAEGLLLHRSGASPAAVAAQTRSLDWFEAKGMPFHAGRSRLERATALAAADRESAVSDARAALAAFERLPARCYADRARALLADLGASPGTARASARRAGPLSRREMEVALLVAEGLTNVEIAERLTVSVRTVTSHLDHIYARLGIGTRTALARFVGTVAEDAGADG